jgi:hypothetical protein
MAFPFASPNGLFNLSRLSVWWLRLDISIERIKPGNPQQNGRHERMHLTLKKEAPRPAGANLLQEQANFDAFLEEFNHERPHEALDMKCPAEVYTASAKLYRGITEPHYPFHDKTVVVTNCGRLCLYRNKINLSTAWQVRLSESKKSTTAFGSSALWITISAMSIWRRKLCSPPTIPSDQKYSGPQT